MLPTKVKVGQYMGLPSILSSSCTRKGIILAIDGGKQCKLCYDLRKCSGITNPVYFLNTWYAVINRALEQRTKTNLTQSDSDDAKKLTQTRKGLLNLSGLQLQLEAKEQHSYYEYTSKLQKQLSSSNIAYKNISPGNILSPDSFLKEISSLYQSNPEFRTSLVFALMKASMNIARVSGGNIKIEEKVAHFYQFISTYSKSAAQVVSANLSGPLIVG